MQHSEHVGQHDGRDAAWRGAIGAAEQIVHSNNNKPINLLHTKAKVEQNWKKLKKVLKKFYKNLKQF